MCGALPALQFTPLDEAGLRTIRAWFDDAELCARLERPTRVWFVYVTREPNVHAWLVHEGNLPVGHLQLDIGSNGVVTVGFFVNPALRGQGYGKRILRALLVRPEVAPLSRIEATAEADNLASQRCLQAISFVQEGAEPDEEGFFHFSLRR
jgi:RimJ/RimL family protein N-acetyltransferase